MSYNAINLNYELDNEQFNDSISLYNRADLNKLTIGEKEDLNHFSAKSILFYILSEINRDVICDYHIIGVGNVDVYDVTTRTIYQFEDDGSMSSKHLSENDVLVQNAVDVIIIFLQDLPDDIFQRYLKVKEYVFSD